MSAKRAKASDTLSNGPPNGMTWAWMTSVMLGSITYRALGVHALRVLAFLMHEHATHGGRENGDLAAPYQQLEVWGVTANDVNKGLAELMAVGFVDCTLQGFMRSGGGEPSRYALTWLPRRWDTPSAEKPTHRWSKVIDKLSSQGIGDVKGVRAWLRGQVGQSGRAPSSRADRIPPRDIEGTAQVQGEPKLQVQGENGRKSA